MRGHNEDQPRPRALVLVRNTVSHDARVLREADTLARLGFDVLIAGVVSTGERERQLEIDGKSVVRLDPLGAIRRVTRRRPGHAAASRQRPDPGASTSASPTATEPGRGPEMRARRFALTLVYYLQGIALAWRMAPAIVHANDYNTMWIGVAAKQLRRSWLVYDCHELWPDRNGRPEWRAWLIACETLFVRIADATLTTSPGYAREIARRYRVPAPVLVRNAQARSEPARGPREGSDEGPVAVYVGGLMPGRGLEVAISAAARVPRLRLRLIGPGNERYLERLRERARKADVADRVELLPPVAPTHVVDAIGYADVGLMLIEPVCRSYELTLPNKLFEYAAAGLPILASDLPVIGQVVRDDGLGEVVAPNDVELIALAMERLIDPEIAREVRERVRSFASRATWDRERATLERVYNEAGR